jgi:hypothetical protein
MSTFIEYNWPAPVANGISLSQTIAANTPLLLNGSYANKFTGTVNFVDDFSIVPRITLTGSDDLRAVNFTITGYQNGRLITEILTGPDKNKTATSVNCFDTVTQIVPSGSATGVQVGVATLGYFPIILLNTAKTNVSGINYALNIVTTSNNPVTYRIFYSLKNNLGTGKYDDLSSGNTRDFVMVMEDNSSQVMQYSSITARNLLIQVKKND